MATADTNRTAELLLLGEIKGIVEGLRASLDAQTKRVDGIEQRVRGVEQRAAVVGAMSGGVMSIGVPLIVEVLRHAFVRIAGG